MNWIELNALGQLDTICEESANGPVLIFKHSTRCPTSRMALERLIRNWEGEEMKNIKPYFLDLISYRNISNEIVNRFGVGHESPQVLIIKKGNSSHDFSHFEIEYKSIKQSLKN